MADLINVQKYRFKHDFAFDNDVFKLQEGGMIRWKAKEGDIVYGIPEKDETDENGVNQKHFISVIISPDSFGTLYSVHKKHLTLVPFDYLQSLFHSPN